MAIGYATRPILIQSLSVSLSLSVCLSLCLSLSLSVSLSLFLSPEYSASPSQTFLYQASEIIVFALKAFLAFILVLKRRINLKLFSEYESIQENKPVSNQSLH